MRSFALSQVLIISIPLALVACSHEQPARSASGYESGMAPASRTMSTTTTTAPATANTATTGSTAKNTASSNQGLTDGQIAAVVRAADVSEIDQAKIAVGKARDPGVKHFAETMIAQHGQNVRDVDELDTKLNIRPTESQLMTELRVNATSVENKLSQIDDTSFDRQYIKSQIDAHRQVLDTLDARLMPAVRSQELRDMLVNLRPRIADHLQMAQTIFDGLK